eukprot:3267749-Rhodomonas_salina.1
MSLRNRHRTAAAVVLLFNCVVDLKTIRHVTQACRAAAVSRMHLIWNVYSKAISWNVQTGAQPMPYPPWRLLLPAPPTSDISSAPRLAGLRLRAVQGLSVQGLSGQGSGRVAKCLRPKVSCFVFGVQSPGRRLTRLDLGHPALQCLRRVLPFGRRLHGLEPEMVSDRPRSDAVAFSVQSLGFTEKCAGLRVWGLKRRIKVQRNQGHGLRCFQDPGNIRLIWESKPHTAQPTALRALLPPHAGPPRIART